MKQFTPLISLYIIHINRIHLGNVIFLPEFNAFRFM